MRSFCYRGPMLKPFELRRCFTLAALLCLSSANAQEFTPGKETALQIGTPADKTLVFVPKNYDKSTPWPVILYYHGTSGKPTTQLLRSLLKDQHAILVGMAYREPGLLALKGPAHRTEYAGKEMAHLGLVLSTISKELTVDRKRIILSGVSKGGWITSLLGHAQPQHFSGMVLLMGGHHKHAAPTPNPKGFNGKPIYIGVGEHDPNYVFSRLGEAVWSQHGARISFDTWYDTGHEFPADFSTLRHWLLRELAPATLQADVDDWIKTALPDAKQTEDIMLRFFALDELRRDPRFALCSDANRKEVRDQLNALVKQSPNIHAAAKAERTFRETMAKEMRIKTLAQMKFVRDTYAKLLETPIDPELKPQVATARERVAKAYENSLAATRLANAKANPIEIPSAAAPTAPGRVIRPNFPGLNGLNGGGTTRPAPPIIR